MHVVVGGWLVGDVPSGADRRLLGILRAAARLLREDERVTLLHGPGHAPTELGPGIGLRQVRIPTGPTWRRALAERAKLPRLLADLDASVVELAALPVARGLPCPVSLTIHDLRDLDGWRRRILPSSFMRRVLRRAVASATSITVPSRFTADRLRAHVDLAPPIRVVPGGVDRDSIVDGPTSESGEPSILHVGHLERRKNLEVLIDALPRLPGTTLRLAGADHGAGRALAARAQRRGVAERVVFEGIVDDERLASLYCDAGVVAVPSRYEGFGLTALEALAAGRPVVVGDGSALAEVVGDAGRVVPWSDAAAWAEALGDELREATVPHEIRRARALELTWDQAAERTVEIWRELAKSRRLGHGIRLAQARNNTDGRTTTAPDRTGHGESA